MKIVFKIMNILIMLMAVYTLIGVITAIVGGNAILKEFGGSSSLTGAGTMMIFLYMLPSAGSALLSFFAGFAGIKENSERCKKLAMIILVLVILDLIVAIANGGASGGVIFNLCFYGFYFYLAHTQMGY